MLYNIFQPPRCRPLSWSSTLSCVQVWLLSCCCKGVACQWQCVAIRSNPIICRSHWPGHCIKASHGVMVIMIILRVWVIDVHVSYHCDSHGGTDSLTRLLELEVTGTDWGPVLKHWCTSTVFKVNIPSQVDRNCSGCFWLGLWLSQETLTSRTQTWNSRNSDRHRVRCSAAATNLNWFQASSSVELRARLE